MDKQSKKSSASSRSGGGFTNSSSSKPSSNNTGSSKSSKPVSDYAYVRQAGFKNERHFMLSYGIKDTPEGYVEAKRILNAMREADGSKE